MSDSGIEVFADYARRLHVSYFNMPVQVPDLRTELRKLPGLSSWPQLVLRIGYCLAEPVPTPRRPLDEVLVQGLN